jgi:hypothetical protein
VLGSVAKQTLVAAVLAWLATRVLRRLVGVALLAALITGAGVLAERRGMQVRGVDRVSRCEVSALVEVARQLPDAISRGSSRAHRPLPARGRLVRCDGDRTLRRTRPR